MGHRKGPVGIVQASVFESPSLSGSLSPASLTHHPFNFLFLSLTSPSSHRLRMGTVWINAHSLRDPAVPTGGCKESGSSWHGGLDVSVPPRPISIPSSALCPPFVLLTLSLSQGLYEYLRPLGTPARLPYLSEDLNYDTFGLAVPSTLPAGPETGPR